MTSSLNVEMRLWSMAQEFKKMREPKITKLAAGYSTNATLIFNPWLKDIEIGVFDRNLSNGEAIHLVKDFTSDQARNAIEFYLDMTPINQQHYYNLIGHCKVPFQMGETSNLMVSNFCSHEQKGKVVEDNFGDDLQVLAHKVFSIDPSWRSKANE